jgi:hypothetical protein
MTETRAPAVAAKESTGIRCVLTFHRVPDRHERDHDLRWSSFISLLDLLSRRRVPIITDLDSSPVVGDAVILTFDDGTADHSRVADELSRRGLNGIFFVPANLIGAAERLSLDDTRRLVEQGHVVGSHTLDHVLLSSLDEEQLKGQLSGSKTALEEITGCRVSYFAPPGGVAHPLMADTLRASGYGASRSMRWGIFSTGGDLWDVPCIPVTDVTWQRGWVEGAIRSRRLPIPMQAAWAVKSTLPSRLTHKIRAHMHKSA